jgi:NAD(P)-dependent dehydrogenase (short-subunit alcohol dehydrogenase family)
MSSSAEPVTRTADAGPGTRAAAARPVALVTGGARRLGRAIALELAAHGWDVAVHYRGSAGDAQGTVQALRALGAQAHAWAADLADEAATSSLLPAVAAQFGRVDALVNNASAFEYDEVATFDYARMQRHAAANTGAAVVLARALHAHVGARGAEGCVVNLLDQQLWNPNPDYFSYTLSKAALESATTMLAMALAPHVRVCGVAPGLTLGSELIDEAMLERLRTTSLLGRGVDAADVAQAVRFVLGNRSMTGSTLMVDAGFHLVRAARDFPFQGTP